MYDRHEDFSATVKAPAGQVFELLDDQTRLSAHMNKRSWRMGQGNQPSTRRGIRSGVRKVVRAQDGD